MAESLYVGWARADITPPLGVYLAGHFNPRPAQGIHDPLTAQALVLALGEERLALVGCDLLSLPGELTSLVRERLQERAGWRPEAVILWATHTHAGPVLQSLFGEPRDEAYFQVLADQLVGVVYAAANDLQPARLRVAWGVEARLSFNRRYRMRDGSVRTNPGVGNPEIVRVDGPIDPTLGALLVDGEEGLQALLVNFACHLDLLGNGNFMISADYPHYMRQTLEAAYGRPLVTLFANGPCGNINHINVFGRRRQGGYDHAQLMGRMLAGEILKIEWTAEPINVNALQARTRQLELPRRPYTEAELEEFRRILADERVPEYSYPKVRARMHLARAAEGRATESVEIQVLRIGDTLAVLGFPAEYFVEYGLRLRKEAPTRHTFVVELANDNVGYVPTPEAFEAGGYEGTSARLAPEAGELMAQAALEML